MTKSEYEQFVDSVFKRLREVGRHGIVIILVVLFGLVYFLNDNDKVDDGLPVVGYVDDAVVLGLVFIVFMWHRGQRTGRR